MKSNELRIGNLVSDKLGNTVTIFSINKTYYHLDDYKRKVTYKSIKPIELTEEWLIKFGFEKINHIGGYSFYSLKRKRNEDKPSISIYKTYTRIGNNSGTKHCKYVHQLQNLYFALTHTELEIK